VLWIRIETNADPDPGRAKPMRNQTNPDPDSDPYQTFDSQKVEFLHKKYT
jgi:hypothetical protein